ncbi:hypothetical protein BDZ89DRAFT_1067251 [Hymenopellis radicata]|nr:hypothetical protein BDZ89DRAFT_1067251 [Hymenopellis radicata]
MLFNYALTSLALSAVAYATPVARQAVAVGVVASVSDSTAVTDAANAVTAVTDAVTGNAAVVPPSTPPLSPSSPGASAPDGATPEQLQNLTEFLTSILATLLPSPSSDVNVTQILEALGLLGTDVGTNDPAPAALDFVGSNLTLGEAIQRLLSILVIPTVSSDMQPNFVIDLSNSSTDTGLVVVNEIVSRLAAALGSFSIQFPTDGTSALGNFIQVQTPVNVGQVLAVGLVSASTLCQQTCTATQQCNAYSLSLGPVGFSVCIMFNGTNGGGSSGDGSATGRFYTKEQ